MNGKRMAIGLVLVAALLLTTGVGAFAAGEPEEDPDTLTFGYITPGPDTWYAMVVQGFEYGAEQISEEQGIEIEVEVLNSNYDPEQERANIQTLVDRGVDAMGVFSFNPDGAIIAAREAERAGIPLVTVDNVGQALETDHDIVAAIDFDWRAMGRNIAQYIAENHPGDNIAAVMGLFEHLPVQFFRQTFEPEVERLGENEIVEIRDGRYDPERAVEEVEDMIEAGVDFDVLFVFNEEMGAAVVRMLEARGLIDDITVITTNGAPYGIELIRDGKIEYSISTSPGWEGMVAVLTLYSHIVGNTEEINRQILLPDTPITPATIDDKTKVIPWEPDPVWLELTSEYFPEYDGLY